MKYCVLIIDGAAGLPLPERGNKTCLELARTPNLDALTREGTLGLTQTVPSGMEPSSSYACMSVLGYDPEVYYLGRAGIEARSMGISLSEGEVAFRCNLVATCGGMMWDYTAGRINTEEAASIISTLNDRLGGDDIHFYAGVNYRHICTMKGHENTLKAVCTPPHDIPDKPIAEFMPGGEGSKLLRDLMLRSEAILKEHPVNVARKARGDIPATMIWLFWSSGKAADMPPFRQRFGLNAALTSGVDLLRGLANMMDMEILEIAGVTDGPDNDYAAQARGALAALERHDLVAIHVEATDEAGHAGSIDDKVEAIERVDEEIVRRIRLWQPGGLRVLIMPDHPTPIELRTHTGEPVPFLLWGPGFDTSGAKRFTEAEAARTGLFIEKGYKIMSRLVGE